MPAMANGVEFEDTPAVKAKVKAGMKREHAFAFKAYSEICGSIGRTRATRAQNVGFSGNRYVERSVENKRSKGKGLKEAKKGDLMDKMEVVSEGEGRSDVVELGSGDEEANVGVGVIESVTHWGEERKSGDVGVMEVDERIDAEKAKRDVDRKIECEEGTNGLVLGNENLEKNKGILMGESLKEDDVNGLSEEGTYRSLSVSMKEPAKSGKVMMNNILEKKIECNLKKEGSCGSSLNLVTDEGGGNGSLAVLFNEGIFEVEEKPFRRVTRSALKQKMEEVKRSLMKDGMEENNNIGSSSAIVPTAAAATISNSAIVKSLRNNALKKFPSKLKDLLESGLLDGVKVYYVRSSKVRKLGGSELHGVIKGSGILCSCLACNGTEVVTPSLFELHAGSANKRPPEYIYLENGNSLRDVMNACKDASLETLDEALRLSIGCSSLKRSKFCLNCRGELDIEKSMILCSLCMELKDSQAALSEKADERERTPEPIFRTPEPILAPMLVDSVFKHSSSRSRSQGKITRKDIGLHKLVFEEGVLPDGTEVGYYSRGQKLLGGCKMGAGILCYCCDTEVSPSQFESHAGWSSRRKPYLHIYIKGGISLHELAVKLSKNRKFSTDRNDDLCSICLDGGDILCCDTCPRAFHKDCLSLPAIPKGEWHCKYCVSIYQREEYASRNANAIAAGRVAGINPNRITRVVQTLETDYGGCVLCRAHDFKKTFGPRQVILCDQCEREFHIGCLKEHKIDDLKELPPGKWFCSTGCSRIHSALEKLVLNGEEKLPDFCLNVIKKKQEIGSDNNGSIDIRWRLLKGGEIRGAKSDKILGNANINANKLLSDAALIFQDRFDPIVVGRSTNERSQNLIPHMITGKSSKEWDFSSMYCAILMVNHVVVSTALVRIFGQELAELPLVGTGSEYEGKGYFQALYSCIEKLLGFWNVKNIVLPAAEEAESLWENKFGFSKMSKDEVANYRKDYQMMVFQGSSMLRKSVPKYRIVGS